jgi:hypothetical protein
MCAVLPGQFVNLAHLFGVHHAPRSFYLEQVGACDHAKWILAILLSAGLLALEEAKESAQPQLRNVEVGAEVEMRKPRAARSK